MTDAKYWIWLQSALGIGSLESDRIIREGVSPETLSRMSRQQLLKTELLTDGGVQALLSLSPDMADASVARAKELKAEIITPDHPYYPKNLTHIDRMPCVLYVQGDLSTLDDELLLTMVGTRKSTEYGEYAAFRLSRDLAAAGCTIVSGLAVGIDCSSHEGALSLDGRTIGFLACGLDVNYPSTNADLKRRILEHNGVLISEFQFGARAMPHHFSIRNRILSGISAGAVVIEAPIKSGAMITASYAIEQNKDIFAVPGGIFSQQSAGCNRLICDGATMALNAYSVLGAYIGRFPASIDSRTVINKVKTATKAITQQPRAGTDIRLNAVFASDAQASSPELLVDEKEKLICKLGEKELDKLELSVSARKIYEALALEPCDCCTIAQRTELRIMEIMSGLTELEISGLAESAPGQRYVACGGQA